MTGEEPPDALTASAFGAAVRAAKTMSGVNGIDSAVMNADRLGVVYARPLV